MERMLDWARKKQRGTAKMWGNGLGFTSGNGVDRPASVSNPSLNKDPCVSTTASSKGGGVKWRQAIPHTPQSAGGARALPGSTPCLNTSPVASADKNDMSTAGRKIALLKNKLAIGRMGGRPKQQMRKSGDTDSGSLNDLNRDMRTLLTEDSVSCSAIPSACSQGTTRKYPAGLPPLHSLPLGGILSTGRCGKVVLQPPASERAQRRRLRFVTPQQVSVEEQTSSLRTMELAELAERKYSQKLSAQNNRLKPCVSDISLPQTSPLLGQGENSRKSSLAQRRQSNAQVAHKAIGRKTSTTIIPLTTAQIHLVRSLWRQVYLTKGPTVIGTTVMQRLFFKCPALKDQFRECPLPSAVSNRDTFAKNHAKIIAELVDRVVESLDDLEAMGFELERVGRVHARVLSSEVVSSKMWNSVAEAFTDCTLEWGDRRCRSETVRKAWALIISYLVERIKNGQLEERKQLIAMRSTIVSLERVAVSPHGTTR